MILTKKELIQRLLNGERLTPKNCDTNCYCYYDETYEYPFRYMSIFSENIPMNTFWNETEWEIYKEKPEWWEPKDGEKVYYVDINGDILTSKRWNCMDDENIIKQNNTFKTKEEAKKEMNLRIVKYRVKKRIWELNDGEFIRFKDNEENWSFDLNNEKIRIISWYGCKFYPNWQYLKTEKLAEQLVKEMYNELLLIRSK